MSDSEYVECNISGSVCIVLFLSFVSHHSASNGWNVKTFVFRATNSSVEKFEIRLTAAIAGSENTIDRVIRTFANQFNPWTKRHTPPSAFR